MLEIKELDRYRELDLEEYGNIVGGVNYSLASSFYARRTKKTMAYTDDSITKLWSYMYRVIAI